MKARYRARAFRIQPDKFRNDSNDVYATGAAAGNDILLCRFGCAYDGIFRIRCGCYDAGASSPARYPNVAIATRRPSVAITAARGSSACTAGLRLSGELLSSYPMEYRFYRQHFDHDDWSHRDSMESHVDLAR